MVKENCWARPPGGGTERAPSPHLLQHLSGKLQLAQLLSVCSRHLGVGPSQVLLLEREGEGQQRQRQPQRPQSWCFWVPAHLGLDALLQGSHSGPLGGRACLGGTQGAAVGFCLQLVVLGREERTAGWWSVGAAGPGRPGAWQRQGGRADKEGQTAVEPLTWRAACRSWERRDAVALSCSRPRISCSSLCPGRGENQGGQVVPLTGLTSSRAPPGPQAAVGRVVWETAHPLPGPRGLGLGDISPLPPGRSICSLGLG